MNVTHIIEFSLLIDSLTNTFFNKIGNTNIIPVVQNILQRDIKSTLLQFVTISKRHKTFVRIKMES